MTERTSISVLVLFLGLFGLGCSSSDTSNNDGGLPHCTPGENAACACADGRVGAQECNQQGVFESCQCTGPTPSDCVPGGSAPCACSDGRTGAQLCNEDRVYAVCECTGDPPSDCVPGQSVACACTDGSNGAQVCTDERRYDPCVCDTLDGGPDGGPDAGPDGGPDGGPDADPDGGSDGGSDAGTEWPETPDDYLTGLVSYMATWTVPETDVDGNYVCCKDFGSISKDFIEEGTNNIDNGWVALTDAIGGVTGSLLQEELDSQLQNGDLVILLDHVDYVQDGTPFVLARLDGAFESGTVYPTAAAGNGQFFLLRSSFLQGSGEPNDWYYPAVIDQNTLSASGETFQLAMGIPGLESFLFVIKSIELQADAQVEINGVTYTNGTFSGWILLADVFAGFNAIAASDTCLCLGLYEDLYYYDVDGSWRGNCVADAENLCILEEEEMCALVAGLYCSIFPMILTSATDLDLDPDLAGYEAYSLGLQWTGVTAEVVGIEP